MRNTGLNEAQAGIKIAERHINNLRYADDTTLMAESEEELKNLLMKVKEESEKVGLKLKIQKTNFMASSPITSWQIDGETVETVTDFIFWDSKIASDGDCSHEIKRCLLLGRKVMTNLDSILKSRDITLPTKVRLVKAMVFPVVMYGMWELDYKKSWGPKNWCFWAVVWRRLLRVPWTARRSNKSILKEISPGCSLEGLMLKLKLQYLGHLMWRTYSFEKTLMLGKTDGRRRRGRQRMRCWMESPDSMDRKLSKLRQSVMDREAWLLQSMGSQRLKTRLTKWTELNWVSLQGREFEISKASFRQCRNHSWLKLSLNFPRAVSMNHQLVSKSSLQLLIDFHFLLHRFLRPHKHHLKWRGCITICHVPSHCLLLLLLSRVQLFATPQTAGFPVLHYLQSLLKLVSTVLLMPSNPLILCHPLLLLPSVFPSMKVLSNELAFRIKWPEYCSLIAVEKFLELFLMFGNLVYWEYSENL